MFTRHGTGDSKTTEKKRVLHVKYIIYGGTTEQDVGLKAWLGHYQVPDLRKRVGLHCALAGCLQRCEEILISGNG